MSRKKVLVHLDSSRGYSRDLLRGIYAYNNSVSHWDIIFEPAYFLKNNKRRNDLGIINQVKPDGCILEFAENVHDLIAMNIPIIQTTSVNLTKNIPYVKGNYASDARVAADYFMEKGFRVLAFFGIQGLEWSEERKSHFKKMVLGSGSEFHEYSLKGDEADVLSHNFEELENWLKHLPKPVGILCCNDDFGQILINSCSAAGIKVPHEIAVLGIDNDELLCNITYPNLSSISRNHIKTANAICSNLNSMMDGQRHTEEIIVTEAMEVIERTSTDTVADRDPDVSKAIIFISKNMHRPLKAGTVAEHVNLSVKVLNRKFKTGSGNSISEEIQMRKLSRFKQLLLANLSVKEIAFELGFSDISHVSRWFSNLEGLAPMEWKKKYAG